MAAAKARIRSGVRYCDDGGQGDAPTGDYELSRDAGRMRLVSPATAREVRLSCDAFCRLVAEGRIVILE
jgi:hypothetical protein